MIKIIIILIIFLDISFSEIIRIPFGIINTEKDLENSPLISKIVKNKIYINITVGSPPQNIKIYLRKDNYGLFISEKNFNKTLSKSLESNFIIKDFFIYTIITGYLSTDLINFGNYACNNNKLNFILSVSDDNSLGALGLRIPYIYNFPEGLSSFIYTLKNNSIISSYTWTLKYYYPEKKLIESINDKINPIGELIIGGDPHEYEENKSKYSKNKYHFLETPFHDNRYFWNLIIKSIYILSDERIEIINNNYREGEVSLKAEYSVIWGTKVYYDNIYSHFFNKYDYIKNNICQEKSIIKYPNLNYIECVNDDKLFDIKKFPSIYFESFEFNKIFELNYKDLFVLDEKINKYIFLIVFPTNFIGTEWNLGIPFLRKYQFTFNEDKKVIGFYNIDENKEGENNKNGETKNEEKISKKRLYFLIGFLFLFFCGILVLLGVAIHKYLCPNKRRKKANELDDGFDYDAKDSLNSNNKINDEAD